MNTKDATLIRRLNGCCEGTASAAADRIAELLQDYEEIQRLRDAELSMLYNVREELKIATGSIREICHVRVRELRRMSARLVENAGSGRENGYDKEADGMIDAAMTLDDEADRIEREGAEDVPG